MVDADLYLGHPTEASAVPTDVLDELCRVVAEVRIKDVAQQDHCALRNATLALALALALAAAAADATATASIVAVVIRIIIICAVARQCLDGP